MLNNTSTRGRPESCRRPLPFHPVGVSGGFRRLAQMLLAVLLLSICSIVKQKKNNNHTLHWYLRIYGIYVVGTGEEASATM